MTTYRAEATRSDGWWAIEVPDVPGAFTQARRLDQVSDMARSVIVDLLEVAPDSFDVLVDIVDPKVVALQQRAIAATEASLAAAEAARKERGDVARALADEVHLPYRDIGRVLGVSHQRVAQMVEEGGVIARKATKSAAKKGR